jgi:hypothetical protein
MRDFNEKGILWTKGIEKPLSRVLLAARQEVVRQDEKRQR